MHLILIPDFFIVSFGEINQNKNKLNPPKKEEKKEILKTKETITRKNIINSEPSHKK